MPADEAASSPLASSEVLTCYQTVVFSPTYQVPAFYFEIHDSSMSPDRITVSLIEYWQRDHPLSCATS